mmetsp:Transcript_78636/g.188688  ORF Transcript_78636/g.188688 Transcript_78636/m.188688 type:complete len:87 (-) Transcript_78636:354-614(-)
MTLCMSSTIQTGYSIGCTSIPPYSYVQVCPLATIQAVLRGIGPHHEFGCSHFVPTRTLANQDAQNCWPNGFAKWAAKLRLDSSLRK